VNSPEHKESGDPGVMPRIRASALLRVRAVWLAPIALAAVLVFFMTLFYIGAIVNPVGHLSGLPVVLVNQDRGATVQGSQVSFGAEVASDLEHSPAVTSRLALDQVPYAQAEARMNSGSAYAAIVIPPGFSASLLSAYGLSSTSAGIPTIQLLTNPRAGSVGVQLATGVAQPALQKVSSAVGSKLSAEAAKAGRTPRAGVTASDPITVATSDFRSLPPDSALGLSAFYISLLAIMCGFLGAVLVNSSIDAALGYGTSEIGPRWRQRMPVPISRWQTLLAKWTVALAAVPILTGILLLVAVGLLGMNAPYPWELWLFTSFAGIAIAAGTLALFAAFGSLGQLLAMLLFVYLALASSGGTVPVQALPSFFRFAASFEPLRQVLGGVRAILYFNAQADAGLTRGIVLTTIGLAFWLIAGAAVTRWYDRRGMDRLQPDVLEYVQRSARAYTATAQAPTPGRETGNDTRTKTVPPETAAPGDQQPAVLARWSRRPGGHQPRPPSRRPGDLGAEVGQGPVQQAGDVHLGDPRRPPICSWVRLPDRLARQPSTISSATRTQRTIPKRDLRRSSE
jgi:YhgE/Pip-like protein